MSLTSIFKFQSLRPYQRVLQSPFINTRSTFRFNRVEINKSFFQPKLKNFTLNKPNGIYLKRNFSHKSYNNAPWFIPAGLIFASQQFSRYMFFFVPFLYRYNILKKYPRFFKVTLGSILLIFIGTIVAGLEFSDYGNRWRFLVLDEKSLIEFAKIALKELKETLKIDNSAISSRNFEKTKEIFLRLLFSTGESEKYITGKEWELLISEDVMFNAFVFISGSIIINTGVYDFCKNDDELAFIIAHELSHLLFAHSAEYSVLSGINSTVVLFLEAAVLSISIMLPVFFDLLEPVISSTISGYFLMPYSRLHEFEADKAGLYLMARAGFDPRKAPGLWRRLDKDDNLALHSLAVQPNGDESDQALSQSSKQCYSEANLHESLQRYSSKTHPESLKRADVLEAMMPDVVPIYLDFIKNKKPNSIFYKSSDKFEVPNIIGNPSHSRSPELRCILSKNWSPLYTEKSWNTVHHKGIE